MSDFNIYPTNTLTQYLYFYSSMTFGNMRNSNLQLEKVPREFQSQSSLRGKIHIHPHKELLSDIRRRWQHESFSSSVSFICAKGR